MSFENPASREGTKLSPAEELHKVVSRPLLPENIDTYFDTALNDVSDLADRLVRDYVGKNPDDAELTKKEIEDKAFSESGLQSIPEVLDLIAEKQAILSDIDAYIQSHTKNVSKVIVPTANTAFELKPGVGTFEESPRKKRVKAVLYAMLSDGVALEEVRLQKGLDGNLMRRDSYVVIEVPALQRVILECDVEGNAGYVLDSQKFAELGITVESLSQMSKDEISVLLAAHPELGRSYYHRGSWWLARLREYLHEDFSDNGAETAGADVPIVSSDEIDPWRGFYIAEDGKHYGPPSSILRRFRAEESGLTRQDEAHIRSFIKDHSARLLKTPQSVVMRGYAYEDVRQKVLETRTLEVSGEWGGFVEFENKHWASTEILSEKFKVNIKLVHTVVQQQAPPFIVRTMPVREGIQKKSNSRKLYAYEDFEPLLGKFEKIPRVESEGEWAGFDKDHYGHPIAIARKLQTDQSYIQKFVLRNPSLETRNLRDASGRVSVAYSFDKVKELWDARRRRVLRTT